jgi:hypothetical protein
MTRLPAAQVTHNLDNPDDLANLRSSGLSDETILAMDCRSVSAQTIRDATGIKSVGSGGYSIPYPGLDDQTGAPLRRWRLSTPLEGKLGESKQRYVAGLGDDPALYIPTGFADLPPNYDLLVVTEGEKKLVRLSRPTSIVSPSRVYGAGWSLARARRRSSPTEGLALTLRRSLPY